jgi:hypothetical protein
MLEEQTSGAILGGERAKPFAGLLKWDGSERPGSRQMTSPRDRHAWACLRGAIRASEFFWLPRDGFASELGSHGLIAVGVSLTCS